MAMVVAVVVDAVVDVVAVVAAVVVVVGNLGQEDADVAQNEPAGVEELAFGMKLLASLT